jgi:hypothetical protein
VYINWLMVGEALDSLTGAITEWLPSLTSWSEADKRDFSTSRLRDKNHSERE